MRHIITVTREEVVNALGEEPEGFWHDANCSLRIVNLLKHDELVSAYSEVTGMSEEELNEFEGGINDWIGFGSVTCYELGCLTSVGFMEDTIVISIEEYPSK